MGSTLASRASDRVWKFLGGVDNCLYTFHHLQYYRLSYSFYLRCTIHLLFVVT